MSVHLLVVLIGAAYLARAKRKRIRRRRLPDEPVSSLSTTHAVDALQCHDYLLANLLTEPPGVAHYMTVGAVLFVCGAMCMATKRNALGVLMGIELVLNGANLNFVAFGSKYLDNGGPHAGARRPADRPVRHRARRGRSGRGAGDRAEFLQQPRLDRRRPRRSTARLTPTDCDGFDARYRVADAAGRRLAVAVGVVRRDRARSASGWARTASGPATSPSGRSSRRSC